MSYIRCLSNPEKLYIWGEKSGKVVIVVGKEKTKYMPCHVFEYLLHGYVSRPWNESVKYKGAKLEELFVKSGKKQTKLDKDDV